MSAHYEYTVFRERAEGLVERKTEWFKFKGERSAGPCRDYHNKVRKEKRQGEPTKRRTSNLRRGRTEKHYPTT